MFKSHLAPLLVAIVACVPKKVHIEGAGETGFKISSIEITDAIKAVDWMNLFSQSLRYLFL